ncbi:PLP-dependent aminotransferase family protein [Trinickia sp. NRRL B-1857]|uniref:MocR-like pyridoxine biosynthesis transcription factor PdxR n=1 Tax=Trinickia sp. NRRL B-1857 TaxID=3162879 RepID=UPI003D2CB0A2
MNDRYAPVSETAAREREPVVWSLLLGAPDATVGLQRWLYDALRQAIVTARLPPGSALPGTRTLAQQYGLARGTVASAYEQLLSEGYLVSRRGSATRVSTQLPDPRYAAEPLTHLQATPDGRPGREAQGPWIKRLTEHESPFPLSGTTSLPRPFHPHRSDIRLFPIDVWRKLHARHLRPSRLLTLDDADPVGLPALRKAIVEHLAISRAVTVSPEQVVIVGSVQQALDLCLRLLTAPGDAVWMEDPGYVGARQIMHASGTRIVDVPIDSDGLVVEHGVREAPGAALAYVTPSRHAPLGISMSTERQTALLRWAHSHGGVIFEDDYDSEYCFRSRPLPALRSLPGAESHVVLAGTFSKLMFPSLRHAYVVLPPRLVAPFVRAASITARSASGLTQAVLADFLSEGHFDRHIRRTRTIYAARARAFEHFAQKYWHDLIRVEPIAAGLDVACHLLHIDESTALQRLKSVGIAAAPLSKYTHRHRHGPALVMGFAPFNEDETERAAQQVAAGLRNAV